MFLYFWILRLAAFWGHKKARKLVQGQARALSELEEWSKTLYGSEVLWIHAASVGEFEQARPIIERLHSELPFRKVLLTFFSPSGYELRKDYPLVDKVTYLPFATKRNAKQLVEMLPLEAVIMVKYEFWPAYLKELEVKKVPTYLISAIFRPAQLFFKPWGKGYLRLLHAFKHIFVQDQASADLLIKHGVKQVGVAGDTRFDRVTEVRKQAKDLPVVEGFVTGAERVIVAGSTWPKDEEMLARYMAEREGVKLVLVPHEIDAEHLHRIFQLFEGRYVRYTEATPQSVSKCRVLLVDTIGVLSSIYRYGHVAYIGGGFGVSIHNTLEAAVYGMPVVFGPTWKKFREAHGLLKAGAAITVKNYREFAQALDTALANKQQMGKAATEYVNSELGATEKIYGAIF
ncbi:MAG: 3-deoxy-D-manno-octulosonic acid transferase [Paludibacteraceae bacterium]|nr:3-deoxy-D-manno-octulosonic acid transferase [Paludibacteraceae bacterium]